MLKDLFWKFKGLLVLATGLSMLSAMASISMLAMITDAINQVGEGEFDFKYSFILFLSVVLVVMLFGFLSQFFMLKLSSSVVYTVRKTLLQRILATSYEKIEQIGGHRVIAAMKSDVATLSNGLLVAPQFIYNLITVLCCFGYLAYSSWQLFLFIIFFIVLVVFGTKMVLNYINVHQQALREYEDTFYSHMNALNKGGMTIHLNLNRRRHFYKVLMLPLFEKIRQKTIKSELLIIGLETVSGTLVFLLIGTLVYGFHLFLPDIGAEVVVSFILVILYMVGPISFLVDTFDDINRVQISLKKIERINLVESNKFHLPSFEQVNIKTKVKSLKADNIFYQYPAQMTEDPLSSINKSQLEITNGLQFSLGPISAEFRSGEVTFIVGENGCGKTTFVNILIGLYSQKKGSILVDGDIVGEELSLLSYQSLISTVFVNSFVFDHQLTATGDIAEDQYVNYFIKKLKMENKVSCSEGMLSSTSLSQGQRKRLSLLSSLVEDSQICIFDELGADQDPLFKHYFYNELLFELKQQGKIVIVISHDDQYFDLADKLIKFENGKVISNE